MEKDQNPSLHSRDLQLQTLKDATAAASVVVSSDQEQRPRPPHLCVDIPADQDHLPTPAQGGITPPPSTRRGQQQTSSSSSSRPPLRSPSLMLRQTVKSLLPAGSFKSSAAVRGYEASISKLLSATTKVMARTSSLPPLDDAALSSSSHSHQHRQAAVDKSTCTASSKPPGGAVHHMCRSQSLPMNMSMKKPNNANANAKSFKRMDSLGGMYRVVPSSTPRAAPAVVVSDIHILPSDSGTIGDDDGGEDIPEEEAVCRICMVELSEGSDTLIKLECSCKGELALAHRDCAVKWFSIKGTRTCEVCKHDVQNLPVTLLRVHSMQQQQLNRHGDGGTNTSSRYDRYRVWHGTPILVIISILAYFCFLEELLVAHEGIAALAISLPFSCILGLFSSLTTTSMVARRYVWIYAAVQFLLVVFFTHLFYKYLHLQAVISIILATFAGFGVGMTGNSIVIEILRWRARRVAPPTTQARRRHRRARPPQQLATPASDQPPSAADVGLGVGQRDATATAAAAGDVENPAVPQA